MCFVLQGSPGTHHGACTLRPVGDWSWGGDEQEGRAVPLRPLLASLRSVSPHRRGFCQDPNVLVNLSLVISRLASKACCAPRSVLGVGRGEAETFFFFFLQLF